MAVSLKWWLMEGQWIFNDPLAGRCINLDWLEVYCNESFRYFPCNAEFFRSKGYNVIERDYGTRQYHEMFTLLDKNDHPLIEIRRNPVASKWDSSNSGIFDPSSCHVRLVNRYCYHPQAVQVLSTFLNTYDYAVGHIYRLDLALDFERFDKGDLPGKFLERYLKGVYSKINQGNISSHGKDRWEGRSWNSVSWGAPSSMVSTKFYCKTQELAEAKDKPYIRYAWFVAGLVDDWLSLTKVGADGAQYKPDIWRVEFSIRAKARNWYVIEDCNGNKQRRIAKEHTLATYATKLDQLHAFAMLAHHYFHFKKFKEGVRKDRCEDKILFDFGLNHTPYVLDRLLSDQPRNVTENALIKRLQEYRMAHPQEQIRNACDTLIEDLRTNSMRNAMPEYANNSELKLLQLLIERRIKQNPKEPIQSTVDAVEPYLDIIDSIF